MDKTVRDGFRVLDQYLAKHETRQTALRQVLVGWNRELRGWVIFDEDVRGEGRVFSLDDQEIRVQGHESTEFKFGKENSPRRASKFGAPMGSRISVDRVGGFGALGWSFRETGGRTCFVTAGHVLTGFGAISGGDVVRQWTPETRERIARPVYSAAVRPAPALNRWDLGLAKFEEDQLALAIPEIEADLRKEYPRSIAKEPLMNAPCFFVGGTSSGHYELAYVGAIFNAPYGSGKYSFTHQLYFRGKTDKGESITPEPGDSGGLYALDTSPGEVLGLGFASTRTNLGGFLGVANALFDRGWVTQPATDSHLPTILLLDEERFALDYPPMEVAAPTPCCKQNLWAEVATHLNRANAALLQLAVSTGGAPPPGIPASVISGSAPAPMLFEPGSGPCPPCTLTKYAGSQVLTGTLQSDAGCPSSAFPMQIMVARFYNGGTFLSQRPVGIGTGAIGQTVSGSWTDLGATTSCTLLSTDAQNNPRQCTAQVVTG